MTRQTTHQTTSSGAPIIKPHLISTPSVTSPIYFNPKQQNYHVQHYHHPHSHLQPPINRQCHVDASSSLLRAYPYPHYSPRTKSLGYEAECSCAIPSNAVYYRQPTSIDYGSVQREPHAPPPGSQVYQGETFVLNEKNYFI